jgi:hypothetical protein
MASTQFCNREFLWGGSESCTDCRSLWIAHDTLAGVILFTELEALHASRSTGIQRSIELIELAPPVTGDKESIRRIILDLGSIRRHSVVLVRHA